MEAEVLPLEDKWINNQVTLIGTLGGKPEFSHRSRDVAYYIFPLEVSRLSGALDQINILVQEDLLQNLSLSALPKLMVEGQVRSFNNRSGVGHRLVISVYATTISFVDAEDYNHLELCGTLCKSPNLRKTPMGREICDLLLAVSRPYGRSDYLPCITWGQNAVEAATWEVGQTVLLEGRMQSRKYVKQEGTQSIEKTAFEVSVVKQERCEE